jgi:hypothetical protein
VSVIDHFYHEREPALDPSPDQALETGTPSNGELRQNPVGNWKSERP